MRDLAARLRRIVREHPLSRPSGELSYVAEAGGEQEPAVTAARLGGALRPGPTGPCVVIDRVWDADHWHGDRLVRTLAPDPNTPLDLFDPRVGDRPDWAERVVFFDIETTGLSGGAGTLPFLVGCGWFDGDGAFRVRQWLLAGPAGEPAQLEALEETFGSASLLVTYNGRTFDVPTMETRWAFHRRPNPTDDLAHFDMLPPARRLWQRSGEAATGCSLTALERHLLGVHRQGDVPGFEIPTRYFHFLRTGETGALDAVVEHNQLDLLSLAALMARALRLAGDGPDACRDSGERLALGRLYERAGDTARAEAAYRAAAGGGAADVRSSALSRLAELLRRNGRHLEACNAWERVLALAAPGRGLTRLERRAAEALAIHLEHRANDPQSATRYAELLRAASAGRGRAEADHRLGRLVRKTRADQRTKGEPLLD